MGSIDVRAVSRCPVDEINVPTYSILVDVEFAVTLDSLQLQPLFQESIKEALFQDELDKVIDEPSIGDNSVSD